MRVTEPRTLLLLLSGSLALTETWAGECGVQTKWPLQEKDLYQSVGYLDDTQFVRYNSDTANPRVEPRAPWMEQEGPEYWDRQTNIAREHSQASRANLQREGLEKQEVWKRRCKEF
uniref:MHC class I-like antigen recognition-like domain-containing protein n=1 Tax=Capra hircus TaxID=9925 RepID=A0A8C2XX14_CAPHI